MSNFKKLSLFSFFSKKSKKIKKAPNEMQKTIHTQENNNEKLQTPDRTIKENYKKLITTNVNNKNINVLQSQHIKKSNFLEKLQLQLSKTRKIISSGFNYLLSKNKIDEKTLNVIEELLLTADMGVKTTNKIMHFLKKEVKTHNIKDIKLIYATLKQKMYDILYKIENPVKIQNNTPFIMLIVGVNGVGKTTTIGKLAIKYKLEGKSVMLAAGDTFRAGATEQLCAWGKIADIPVISQHLGADPAAVIFDAIQSAQSKKIDILIADTAGRFQNKKHLMKELKKIITVIKKLDKNAPHEIMLIIDASNGQNVLSQTKLFHETLKITGITITKLDGSAKGGIIFAIADQFSIPIRYIGTGQKKHNINVFKSSEFIKAIFSNNDNS